MLFVLRPCFPMPHCPTGRRVLQDYGAPVQEPLLPDALTPPENRGKLSLSECQVFCVEWLDDLLQGGPGKFQLLNVQRTPCLPLSISLTCLCHLGS